MAKRNKLKLTELVEAMEITPEYLMSYADLENNQIIAIISGLDDGMLEDDFLKELEVNELKIEKNPKQYIALPDKFDINEMRAMRDFALSIEDQKFSNSLFDVLHHAGAYRNFKNLIHNFEVADRWYQYRADHFMEVARSFCEDNKIEFV